jgi:hypothetical protein
MIVMPACSSGWLWHSLARETGRIGHLYSPRSQRGPWPWFPYACDNGAFSCWNPIENTFDNEQIFIMLPKNLPLKNNSINILFPNNKKI